MAKIALGTWAWGAGAFGGDTVFGSNTTAENLKPVFDAAMKNGLSLWDTATVYGMSSLNGFWENWLKNILALRFKSLPSSPRRLQKSLKTP